MRYSFYFLLWCVNIIDMDFKKTYNALRKDNGKKIKGSLLYDADQDAWRIVKSFFDVPKPKTDHEFGVFAPEVEYLTIEEA